MAQSVYTDTIRVIKQSITYDLVPAEEGGYVVTVVDDPSCSTEGDTLDEAIANAEDALAGSLLVDRESGFPIPKAQEAFLQRHEQHTDEQDQGPTSR
jgi:predicted RNase H-like HicB family nuclease